MSVRSRGGRRHRAVAHRQEGQATAELAVAVIGLIAAMAPLLAGVQLIIVGARAQEGARAVAREVARGDAADGSVARLASLLPNSQTSVSRDGADAVVTVRVPVVLPFGASVTVNRTARAALEQP